MDWPGMKKNYRQGDVLLIACGQREHGKPIAELTLASGEATGHAHKLVEGDVKLSELDGGELLLEILGDQAVLRHGTDEQIARQQVETGFDYVKEDNHEPQVLPGHQFFLVVIQKDYVPGG